MKFVKNSVFFFAAAIQAAGATHYDAEFRQPIHFWTSRDADGNLDGDTALHRRYMRGVSIRAPYN